MVAASALHKQLRLTASRCIQQLSTAGGGEGGGESSIHIDALSIQTPVVQRDASRCGMSLIHISSATWLKRNELLSFSIHGVSCNTLSILPDKSSLESAAPAPPSALPDTWASMHSHP